MDGNLFEISGGKERDVCFEISRGEKTHCFMDL